jgi:putative oxidoreductase
MQKLFGWFGGPGIDGTLKDLDSRRIPRSIAWLIIADSLLEALR